MGSTLRVSPSILAASTSAPTTWLPVSTRHAPTTRPTYPVPTTVICIPNSLSAAGAYACLRGLEPGPARRGQRDDARFGLHEIPRHVPRIDDQCRVVHHELVVDRFVIGHDH